MINLLPQETKQGLLYARRNAFLIRTLLGISVGLLVLAIVIAGSYVALHQQVNSYNVSIEEAETALEEQNETETIARVQEISNSLNLVVGVLSDEVLFSELLRQVGTVMPSGTALQNLSVSGSLSGALDLEAIAVDYDSASQVQINLEDPNNGLFEEADLIAIDCNGDDPTYPCKVSLRAQFSNENDFRLLGLSTGVPNE